MAIPDKVIEIMDLMRQNDNEEEVGATEKKTLGGIKIEQTK